MQSMLMIFTEFNMCMGIIRDEHVDDVLLHSHTHTYMYIHT